MSSRKLALKLIISYMALYGVAQEESTRLDKPVVVNQEQGYDVLVLPLCNDALNGQWDFGDTQLSIETFEENVSFRATFGARTRTQWMSRTDTKGQFAFDLKTRKFRRLEDTIRVELEDYDTLTTLVENVDGRSGKAFPILDFAVIYVKPQVEITSFRALIAGQQGVKSAKLMFQLPINIPL